MDDLTVTLDDIDAALKWVSDRMDLLAFTTPKEQSWESIYRQLRHEVADQRAAITPRRKQASDG